MLKSEGEKLRRVIVCTPRTEYFQPANLKAHNISEVADTGKAKRQHDKLKTLLRRSGARVIDIPELPGHPNSVFTRDSSLITPWGFIRLRMGLPTRRGEDAWMAERLEALDEPCAGAVESPGTVEGGDIILAGRVAFIGNSKRTNKTGTKQLARLLIRMGYEVRIVILPPAHLHLGGVMSLVSPQAVLYCSDILPASFLEGFDKIGVSCPDIIDANVACLGDNEVIAADSNEKAIEALDKRRFKVNIVNLSEFTKGRGGPTCLILPVERG